MELCVLDKVTIRTTAKAEICCIELALQLEDLGSSLRVVDFAAAKYRNMYNRLNDFLE